MRYALLLHSREPADGEIDTETIAAMQEAFGAYGRALEAAGVLVAAEVLQSSDVASTVTLREGSLQVQDGPSAETKETLAGIIVVDVPDLDAALAGPRSAPAQPTAWWRCAPAATSLVNGSWT